MDGDPALESRSIADFAAAPPIELQFITVFDAEFRPILQAPSLYQFIKLLAARMIGLFALGADPFAQALGKYSQHGVGKVEGIAPEIQ